METDIPSAREPPLASIIGIQFGLLTSSDILKLSVYSPETPLTRPKELADPKLGLPLAKGFCGTCNGGNVDQCQGHFGHCLLPLPIYHPNHVSKLVAALKKVCLNCSQPKKKRVGKLPSLLAPALKKQLEENATNPQVEGNVSTPKRGRAPPTPAADKENDDEDDIYCSLSSKGKRKFPESFIDMEARAEKEASDASDSVIALSSDEEDLSTNARNRPGVHEDNPFENFKASDSTVRRSWNLRKRKGQMDYSENKSAKRQKIGKGKAQVFNLVVSEDPSRGSPAKEDLQGAEGPCKYCSGGHSDRYPEVQLKVEVKQKTRDENLSKAIWMEYTVKEKDIGCVAPDYWSFVEGPKPSRPQTLVKRRRLLLPSEALKIVAKIPKAALASLGMDAKVAWPEALIVECVPVPPNCTRIQDDSFGSTNLGFTQGSDRATMRFNNLLNKISSIGKARFGKPKFDAAIVEASELQSIYGLHLREKGAPKAVPGTEKKRIDHNGRLQKRDSRWSLEWMKRHFLGKRSGYSARNVLTGDPFLGVEEIGIPQLVAKYVTIPERVNKLNMETLQECVRVGKECFGRYRACGAVRFQRGSERFEVTKKSEQDLQIGDIVHRHLKNGDLVFVNRPPSLHKHSLLALKVQIQEDTSVFTINPAICAPLHADFDGDCLHLFVPQSEEAKAELHQLMTVSEQILPSPDGKTIIGMSQDIILATHLMTSNPLFLNKEAMEQMAMWTTRRLPIPVIVKASPAGGPPRGPLWAGKQVIDLTLPKGFSFMSDGGAVDIQDGELVSYGGQENWLTSTNGLVRVLAKHSPQAAIDHLDSSQAAFREWLLFRGFSVSLRDFYGAEDQQSRRKMMDDLMAEVDAAENLAVRQSERVRAAVAGHPKLAEGLGDIAVGYFQREFSEIVEALGSEISDENQLLAMVRSGSKGSLAKVIQQMGCLGLQLSKGDHLLSLAGNPKLSSIAASMSCDKRWQARGLVRSSYLDGLDPLEFFLHSKAVRAGLLRQSLEVTQPGELFKNLMLFLRDLHVSYDGTVRNKCGLEIIQFAHDGFKSSTAVEENSKRKESSVMPGEAVGILAATAIAEPAYKVMLEANHHVGSKQIRPLALLQDTIFPRSGSKLKASDRRAILRLKPCSCNINYCNERRALRLKDELQPLPVKLFATAVSIQFVPENSLEWSACQDDGIKLRLPWVGHIQFDMNAMLQNNLSMERVVTILENTFTSKSYKKVLAEGYLGSPIFFCRDICDCMGAPANIREIRPCLHFSASLKSRTSKRMAIWSSKRLLEFLDALRNIMVPLILKTTVKGDERVESAKVIWEDAAWCPPSGISDVGENLRAKSNGELVVEVTVQEHLSSNRGSPWSIMKEVGALIDVIDWRRSAPYSVQELRHALGVEAARDCILQRLTLATKAAGTSVNKTHLKLVADFMVHSGEVQGITAFGYRDLMRSLKTSAPFTTGAFRAPIKTFMEAGEKGDEEVLSGVLSSSIFGKRVPVGTGAAFTLQLLPQVVLDPMQLQSMDIFDCLAKVDTTIKAEFPETPVASEVNVHDNDDAGDWANDALGGAKADAGDWAAEDGGVATEGEWGAKASPAQATKDWSTSPSKNADAGAWGAEDEDVDLGHGGEDMVVEPTNVCASSSPLINADAGQWGAEEPTNEWDEEPSGVPSKENLPDFPAEVEAEAATEGGWGMTDEIPEQAPRVDWNSHDSEMSRDSRPHRSRRDEPKEFKPTGANTIPLGKMRHFGPKVVDAGSEGVKASSSQLLAEAPDPDSGWGEPVQEVLVASESWWEDTLSGCPPPDNPTGAGAFGSPPRAGQNNGARYHGESGGRGAPNSGRSMPMRLDNRKDSDDWLEIIDIVREVRNILQTYEPEDKLNDVDQDVLMTKVLPHHPASAAKVGCGVAFLKVALYKMTRPNERPTKCFFVVRTDGTQEDFSYHKSLQTMAASKNPPLDDLYAAAFLRR